MTLIFRRNIDGTDHDFDFLDALRDTCAANFIMPDDGRFDRLEQIRDTLIANDRGLRILINGRPDKETSYRQQHAEAEAKLSDELAAMKLPDIIVRP